MKTLICCAVLLLSAGCFHGPTLEKFEPAHWPAGIRADIDLRKGHVGGELLEVHDTALVMLTDSARIVLIRIDDIAAGRFKELGYLISDGSAGGALTQLRLLSRFPTGMTPKIRADLLAAYGLADVEAVR